MLDQARAGAKYPEYSGSLHHQPPPLRRTPPQLLHIQRASCLKAATLIPFASTKMFLARISLIMCSVALSLDLQQLILIVQAQKPRTEFRPRRKALRGKKSSFKMPLLIIAGSDPLLLIRKTLSCPSEESSCTVHKVKGGSSAIESEVHMHPDFDFLWKLFRRYLVSQNHEI